MKSLLVFALTFLFADFTFAQVMAVSGTGQSNSYVITNAPDDKSTKEDGSAKIYVQQPYYNFLEITGNAAVPVISDFPVIKVSNTSRTNITDMYLEDSLKVALVLLYFTTNVTSIDNSSSEIDSKEKIQFHAGDLAWAFWDTSSWHIWPLYIKE